MTQVAEIGVDSDDGIDTQEVQKKPAITSNVRNAKQLRRRKFGNYQAPTVESVKDDD